MSTPTSTRCPVCGIKAVQRRDGTMADHRINGAHCDGSTTQYLGLPWPKPPLSLNDRMHWAVKARITSETRQTVALLARKLTPVETATITLHYRPRDDRRRDADNLMASIKPCLDGLRDARIIRDDSADLVVPQVHIHEAETGLPGSLWLEINPLKED